MQKSKSLVALSFAATLATSTQGFAQTQPDPNHPVQGAASTEIAPASQEPGSSPGSPGTQGNQMMQQHMMGPGLIMPSMDPVNGRKLFASKGCVVCHSVNGIGGTDAASLDAATMTEMTNPFDFVANMWRGAQPMIEMQGEELGGQIEFTGQELADIIAFLHHAEEQKKFSEDDIPPNIKAALDKMKEGEGDKQGNKDGMGGMTMKPKSGNNGN